MSKEQIKTFEQIVDEASQEVSLQALPLCHTTTEGFVVNIIHAKNLASKKQCNVWNEYLVYFFYGKASYLTQNEIENYTDNPPITLLFEVDENLSMRRALPFDSGGFNRYKIRPGYTKENFAHHHPNVSTLKGLVKLLYQDNMRYLKDQVSLTDLERFENICSEAQEIKRVYIKAKQNGGDFGKQIYSIEVQYEDKVKFDPKYIIMPYNFTSNNYWNVHFREQFPNVIISFYGQEEILEAEGGVLTADEYQMLMRKKVKEIITGQHPL